MSRREFIALLASASVVWPFGAPAQDTSKIRRIGFLRFGEPPKAYVEGFRKGLRELGYIEGQTVAINFRLTQNAAELWVHAADLILQKVDVILASGTQAVLWARDAASSVPVVFVSALDPVAAKVAASLARPGGNITGFTAISEDLTGKRLQLLKELIPDLAQFAVMVRASSAATAQYIQNAESAARALAAKVQFIHVADPSELGSAIGATRGAQALFVVGDAMFTTHRARIAELALQRRLPTVAEGREYAEDGALMSYGANFTDLHRRAANHVHKIFRGAKPADIPIEQPATLELVFNLRTAKALGITVPPSFLLRVDDVIE